MRAEGAGGGCSVRGVDYVPGVWGEGCAPSATPSTTPVKGQDAN